MNVYLGIITLCVAGWTVQTLWRNTPNVKPYTKPYKSGGVWSERAKSLPEQWAKNESPTGPFDPAE